MDEHVYRKVERLKRISEMSQQERKEVIEAIGGVPSDGNLQEGFDLEASIVIGGGHEEDEKLRGLVGRYYQWTTFESEEAFRQSLLQARKVG